MTGQALENERVMTAFAECNKNEFTCGGVSVKRLYHCTAYTWTYARRYIILVSYSTITAIFDRNNDTLYDGLRYVYGYTATSNQHYYKFRRWLVENGYEIRHEYRYYD